MKIRFQVSRMLQLALYLFVLVSCSSSGLRLADPRALYKTFDGRYINQVAPAEWSPALQVGRTGGGSDRGVAYFPSGKTMTRSRFQGLVDSRALENYLNGIVAHLLARSPVSGVNARVVLVGDDEYGAVQAMPDGVIAMPLRFISESDSEDEIAWVLGHELSHIILKHHNSSWMLEYQNRLLGAVENVLVLSKSTVNIARSAGVGIDDHLLDSLYESYKLGSALFVISKSTLFPAWSRSQEEEADLLGLDLIAYAGYSVDEADRVLAKLEGWSGSRDKLSGADINKEEAILEQQIGNAHSLNDLIAILGKAIKDSMKSTIAQFNQEMQATHKDVVDRRKDLAEYMEREYADAEVGANVEGLKRVMSRSGIRRTFNAYVRIWEAEQQLSDGNIGQAERLLRTALAKSGAAGRESYLRLVFFRVRLMQGKRDKALQNLQIALRSPNTTMEVFDKLVSHAFAKGDYLKAANLLDREWREFEHPPQLYPVRIRLVRAINSKDARLRSLLLECQARGDQATRDLCRTEFLGKT